MGDIGPARQRYEVLPVGELVFEPTGDERSREERRRRASAASLRASEQRRSDGPERSERFASEDVPAG